MNQQTANVQAEKANTYDAIVIGSGVTGGWAAKELTEKGLRTIVLEAGQTIVPERDYVEHVPTWKVKFRGMRDRQYEKVHQRRCKSQVGDEWNAKFFSWTTSRTPTPRRPTSRIFSCAGATSAGAP